MKYVDFLAAARLSAPLSQGGDLVVRARRSARIGATVLIPYLTGLAINAIAPTSTVTT